MLYEYTNGHSSTFFCAAGTRATLEEQMKVARIRAEINSKTQVRLHSTDTTHKHNSFTLHDNVASLQMSLPEILCFQHAYSISVRARITNC